MAERENSPKIDNLQWRNWCRIATRIELGVSIMATIAFFLVCIVMIISSLVILMEGKENVQNGQEAKQVALAFPISVLMSVTNIHVFSTIILASATEVGQTLNRAIYLTDFWKEVNLAVIGLTFFGMYALGVYFMGSVTLLWQCFLCFLVWQYSRELQNAKLMALLGPNVAN